MWASLGEGVRFVRSQPIFLGAITLDLFAVLFGGAEALLPIFAADILRVGPEGLGILRASHAAGAVLMSVYLSHRRPLERPGRALLIAVAIFGLCMIGFGLSTIFWLSVLLLVVGGMADNVSVVIRSSLLQTLTPPHLLGAGLGGKLDLHRQLERAGRLRVGRRGQAARHRTVGRNRGFDHPPRGRGDGAEISGTAQGWQTQIASFRPAAPAARASCG